MLSYDLCRQLKNSGFPQSFDDSAMNIGDDMISDRPGWLTWDPEEPNKHLENGIYMPTVEELLRELGEDFEQLMQQRTEGSGLVWVAAKLNQDPKHVMVGTSPEEALTALYLALHP